MFDSFEHEQHSRIDTVLNETIPRRAPLSLSGITSTSHQGASVDAVYASYGEDNQLVEVAKVDQNSRWVLPIPTLSLPPGKNILRVWSYSAKTDHFVQIGHDIKINLVA